MVDWLETPMLLPPEAHVQPHGPVECLGLTFESNEARRAYFLEKLRENPTAETLSIGKGTFKLRLGDLLVVESAGGGGYGNAVERPSELRELDVEEGYV